jgi:hypothetical protein
MEFHELLLWHVECPMESGTEPDRGKEEATTLRPPTGEGRDV